MLPPQHTDFLTNVAAEWETATEPARRAGIRVVNLRFAPILRNDGKGVFTDVSVEAGIAQVRRQRSWRRGRRLRR